MLTFEVQRIMWDLSMKKTSYKLKKKRKTKDEKFEKSLKMCNIINYKPVRYN